MVYEDLIIRYPKRYSIYLRWTIGFSLGLISKNEGRCGQHQAAILPGVQPGEVAKQRRIRFNPSPERLLIGVSREQGNKSNSQHKELYSLVAY